MKSAEMVGKSDEEIALALSDTEKHLFQMRFQSSTDRTNTSSETQKARKDIARIKTEQRRRELVALEAMTAEQLPALIAELHAKAGGPGKRRVQRSIARLETHRAHVVDTVQAPAKGK